MNLVRARSWGEVKPPADAQIDWGHPIASDLVFASVQNGMPFDLVTHTGPTARNSAVRLTSRGLYNATNTGLSSVDFTTGPLSRPGSVGLLTMVTFQVWNGSTIAFGGSATHTDSTNASNQSIGLQGNNDGTFGGFVNGVYLSLASPASGVPFMQSVRRTGVSRSVMDRWTGSARLSAVDTTSPQAIATSAPKIRVGCERSAAQMLPGYVTAVYLWSRILRDEELQQLAVEPYAFIAPPGPKALYIAMSDAPAVPANTGQFFAVL